MSTYGIVNRKDAQALKGQGVLVTLSPDEAAQMENWAVGDLATADTSGKTGTIGRIDSFGNTILINPIQPDRSFDSGVYGYLGVNEAVTITY